MRSLLKSTSSLNVHKNAQSSHSRLSVIRMGVWPCLNCK